MVENGQFSITLDEEGPEEMKNLCREYTLPRNEEASRVRGWILGKTKIRHSLGCEGLPSSKTLRYRNHGRISVSRQHFLGFEL